MGSGISLLLQFSWCTSIVRTKIHVSLHCNTYECPSHIAAEDRDLINLAHKMRSRALITCTNASRVFTCIADKSHKLITVGHSRVTRKSGFERKRAKTSLFFWLGGLEKN
jgi:hypothetical protein